LVKKKEGGRCSITVYHKKEAGKTGPKVGRRLAAAFRPAVKQRGEGEPVKGKTSTGSERKPDLYGGSSGRPPHYHTTSGGK